MSFNKGLLSDQEIQKLQKLNFDFDPYKTLFEIDFQELLKFKETNGHVDVPITGNRLGRRVNKYRTYYRKEILNQEKIDRLTNIGFQFVLKENISWDNRFEELKEYYKTHNTKHAMSSINSSLYYWEKRQRIANIKNKLDKEQVEKLNSIDFDWEIKTIRNKKDKRENKEPSNEEKWDEMFQILVNYKIAHGSLVLSSNQEFDKLRRWCLTQRIRNNKKKLLKERFIKLDDLGFTWIEIRGRKINQLRRTREIESRMNSEVNFDS